MKSTRTKLFSLTLVAVLVVVTSLLAACARDNSQDLVKAAKTGDVETVRRLLADGADVEATDEKHHATVLMWAAHEGQTDVMNVLIGGGAQIDAGKSSGETALWFAAQQGRLEATKILVDHGASIDVVGLNNETAVEVARKNGHEEIAIYLQDIGAGG